VDWKERQQVFDSYQLSIPEPPVVWKWALHQVTAGYSPVGWKERKQVFDSSQLSIPEPPVIRKESLGVPELGGSWQRDADYFLVVWKENNQVVEGSSADEISGALSFWFDLISEFGLVDDICSMVRNLVSKFFEYLKVGWRFPAQRRF